jgi:putative transposase
LGLTAGPVPARVDASVKAGLLDLIDDALGQGWTRRAACTVLDLDDTRALRWARRRVLDRLEDAHGGVALHGLLESERAAIVEVYQDWAEIDRSARKLAHRGSRLDKVFVSPSTVRRVLAAEGLAVKGFPPRDPAPRSPWPDWLEWKPNRVWAYDVTHFTRAKRCAVAILDMVSRKWLTTLVSAEETSTQIEVAFTAALAAEGLLDAADARATEELHEALASGNRTAIEAIIGAGQVPLLLAVSDNGPQMRSVSTREFLAGVAIAQQFGRPHTPTDQAWIETLFGHVKGEWPHLEKITDPGDLVAELDRVRPHYNGVRLHAGIGYVTPDDEHEGRGDQIRRARRDGMARARAARIAYRRNCQENQP